MYAIPLTATDTNTDAHWTRPPSHIVKCNYDAGFNSFSVQVTGGWIIRDINGNAKSWGSTKLHLARSPLEAEGEALLFALQQAWLRGFTAVMFEGDCEVLINIINGVFNELQLMYCVEIYSFGKQSLGTYVLFIQTGHVMKLLILLLKKVV